ncbi:hypothetical protein M407DRAFT_13820 [Tulasnella calospora MUT 4182]|uniref:Right handed beta helix domain-containing protein n=1 Tax=Tulasnella calospora MUT 4182 TaxID=1051891 RepID=A0A0C3QVQ5_9AGAM|nr:hypothetical protein M407DRAFT_13820 [Tulasnella calospora MUT 4182]
MSGRLLYTLLVATASTVLPDSHCASAASVPNHARQTPSCFPIDPQDTIADRINAALSAPGATGFSLKLCPDTNYPISAPIKFAFPNQEITTQGFPGLDLSHRATITVNGPINADGTGHTTAVDGTCENCISVALRYVQIQGNRGSGPVVGGANIEFGGNNQNQVIEWVHSEKPRSWSCLHVAEGPFTCANALIQNNDIGPCGSDDFQQWADGISLSCKGSNVFNNTIIGATDGGIVVFGSPGSWLGGINLVDYDPWAGDYTGVVVENNQILGGFATSVTDPATDQGKNSEGAFIKIGIAMGPRTWFGKKFGMSLNRGAVVRNNTFQGAFGYAMAAAAVSNFTVSGNTIDEDVSFIGSVGPNCSTTDVTPEPAPFVFNSSQVFDSSMQQAFVDRDADALTCILPDNDDWWPYVPPTKIDPSTTPTGSSGSSSPSETGKKSSAAPLAVGLTIGIIGAAAFSYGLRAWYMRRREAHQHPGPSRGVRKP